MKDPRTLLNKQTTQTTQINTKSTGMKDPRTLVNVQTPKTPAPTPTQNAFNILNNANKVQSYNDVTQPVKSRIVEPMPTNLSQASAPQTQAPTFKTLEEAQEYAKNNNINVISPSKEQVQKIESRNKLQPSNNGMVIELNEEDKDFYLSGNRLNIYKNSMELAENSVKLAEERYNNASESEKELALRELNKAKEKYQEKLKDYTTAVKYDEYYNPLGKHLRNIAGTVSRGVSNVGNYLGRTLEENRNNAIGNSYDNIDADALYKYLQNPNDISLRTKGFNSLIVLDGKARTSENAKKLFEELTSGNFEGSAKDLEERIESIRKQDNEDKKIMKNTYDYVETNDEIIQNMNLSDAEKTVYDAEKVISNMLPTIGAGAINPALGRATLFANANESAFNEALRDGASYNQAENYGNIVGGIEFGSEMLFDSAVGKAIGLGGLSSSEPYANYLGNIATNKFGKTIGNVVRGGTNFAGDLLGEGVEETVSEFANPFAKMATYNPNAPLATPEQLDKAFTSSLLPTAILGGGAQAINGVNNAINNQQLAQNVSPQSPNTQVQQQTNEIIPQQTETQQNANLTPNNLQTYKAIRSDVENANLDAENKPQGLYFSNLYDKNVSDFSFPFKDSELNTTYEYDITPTKPLNVESFELQTDRSSSPIQVDAGVSALRQLVGDTEFNRINGLNKQQLQEELSSKYPQYDFSRYFDKLELMSAYGGIMAREQGYDAIIPQRSTNKWTEDVDNEIVALNNSILKRTDAQNLQKTGQNDFDNALNRAVTDKNSKGKTILGKINDFARNKIQQLLGIDVSNRQHTLADNDIRHMLNEHGNAEIEAKRGQIPITEEDVKRIPSIIDSPDDIVLGSRHQDGQTVRYVKKFEDGINFVVEVVPERSGALKIKTMWKKPIAVVNSTNTPNLTSKTEGNMINSTSSNNIIQSNENYVNNQNIMPSVEQLQARDLKQGEEISNTLNMKKPKLEDIAELTEEQAQLPIMAYKQKADKNTPYRRKFWDNVESSKIVSKDVKERVNMTNYERKHNNDVLEKMKDRLDTEPMKVAQEWFRKDIKKATEQDVALGAILLERYQAEGRIEEAVNVVEKLADMGTEAGRTVQMYSIFQRLTPEGMMMYQQRKLNSALETLTQKQTGKWVEQNKDKFKLTEDDATFITAKVQEAQNAPTERQKQIALAEIESRINDKLPPEAGQSIKAYRRIAMLFNPKTQVRNVVGNITVMPLNYVTDLVGTAIDKAVAKKTGVRTTAMPNVKTIGKGFVKGASETIDDYRRGIRTAPTGSRYEIQNNAKSFNEDFSFNQDYMGPIKIINVTKNATSKVLNKLGVNKPIKSLNKKLNVIDRLLSTVLELGDRPFYEASYQNALEAQMKANNVTEPTQEMIDIASNVALSQTWQDNNNYTKAVLGIRNAMNFLNINGFGFGDLVIPFAKTPANLTKAMVEYSPAGLIPALINYNDMNKAISRGDMTPMQQKKFVTSVGKAVAGTMLYAIAGALVQGGAVTGSSDDDKDVANFEKNVLGIQPYSIKIGDKTFTYNWAQPLATPFAVMADTYKMSKENAKLSEILLNTLKVGVNQLAENSFLQGVQELLTSTYGEESLMDNLVGAVMDLPTQFTPTLLGQIATQFDATKRQTFENGDTVGTMVNEVKNKLPGAKNTLAPQVNTFGEEIQNYGGDNNPFNVFLNPGNISSANATDTQKELYALYEVTKDKTIFPRQAPYSVSGGGEKVQLSSQDRAKYQKTSGQYVTENLGALFDSEFYKSLENDKKAQIVNKIVSDADTTSKDIWIDTKTTEELAELKNDLKEANIPLIDYYNAWIAQKDVEGEKNQFTGKTKTGTKKQARIKAIDEAVGDNLNTWQVNKLYEILN